jgi:hypothetical protein
MILKASLSAVALLSVSLSAVSAWAQAPKATPTISAQLVDRLCPVTGAKGLKLGALRSEQPRDLMRSLRKLPAEFAPFTSAELLTTAWSEQVAAITYRGPLPEGQDETELLYAFDDAMQAAGWGGVVTDNTITPLSSLGGRSLEREVEVAAGKQMLLLEFDTSGALALRCGDPALLELDRRELGGTLEPGSPRPVPPLIDAALRLPKPEVCQSQALRKLTATSQIDEEAPEFVSFAAATVQQSALSQFGKRLNTWIEWKLLNSGKVDDNRLMELRATAAKQDVEGEMKQLMAILGLFEQIAAAREHNDEFAACEAMRQFLVFDHDKLRVRHQYWTRVNAALETEARRLGVALD